MANNVSATKDLEAMNENEVSKFWREALLGFAAPTPLWIHSDSPSTGQGSHVLRLSPSTASAIRTLANAEALALATIIEGAWAVLLHRYSGNDDLVFGVVRECASASGELAVNTIPLRLGLTGTMTGNHVFDLIKTFNEASSDYLDVSFDRILEWSGYPADIPLFESSIGIAPLHGSKKSTASLRIELTTGADNFLKAEYDSSRFDEHAISQLLGHLENLLKAMGANPSQHISAMPFLTQAERDQLLIEWNDTHASYPDTDTICKIFEAQATSTPDATAVSFEGERVTYRELSEMADLVAKHLRECGVGAEIIVAICMERSIAMVAGLLGILKAGGAYLPLDPSYPIERLAFMLEDSRTAVVLTERKFADKVSAHGACVLCFDGKTLHLETGLVSPLSNPNDTATADNLAYVIYTSGSTGQPKGVQICNRALVNFLTSMRSQPGLTSKDVLLAVTTISFDIAALELFLPLTVGAQIVLATRELATNATLLAEVICTSGVTVMQATPATWRLLVESGWRPNSSIRIFCGGEALPRELANKLLEGGTSLWNLYGPTETTIWSTLCRVEPGRRALPIGRPIANTQIYILDRYMNPVPTGVPGELYIGGDGLARGYLNRSEMTAQRFVDNPFSTGPNSLLYKTGDLATYRSDGNIEYHGRMDEQVKIRGFRIELAEIEAVLLQHPDISQCAVTAPPDTSSGRRLVACLVMRSNAMVSGSELSEFLKKKLPDYMVPSTFVLMDSLPLTPNGKIDRRALPTPGEERFRTMRRLDSSETFLPATTSLQLELIGIWEETLDVQPIGIRDNFFDLGGHSLLAIVVAREVEKKLGRQISIATIFRSPTVEELAVAMSNGEKTERGYTLDTIRGTGSRTPFFCIPGLFDLARHLGSDQPCYGLNVPLLDDPKYEQLTIEEIATACIKMMRSVQPNGPYCVGGYSFFGVVAFEIAHQLKAIGELNTQIILFDPDPPKPFPTSGLGFYFSRFIFHGRKLVRMNPREQAAYLAGRIWKKRAALANHLPNAEELDMELETYLRRTEIIHARYQAVRYDGSAIMFLAQDTIWRVRTNKDPRMDWAELVGNKLEICGIPGTHASMIREPNVRALAQSLAKCLEKACCFIALSSCLVAGQVVLA